MLHPKYELSAAELQAESKKAMAVSLKRMKLLLEYKQSMMFRILHVIALQAQHLAEIQAEQDTYILRDKK